MTGLWIAILFLIWYLIALYLSETFGKKPGAVVETIFFISMIFSPVVAVIFILHKNKKN